MAEKPRAPFPPRLRRLLRRVLPQSFYLRYVGRHEQGSMRLWRGIARGLPQNASVLDIGAFRGALALAAREVRADLRVFAFEPNPREGPQLQAACAERDIVVEALALAEQPGELQLAIESRTSHVVEDGTSGGAVAVPATTLDAWVREREVHPSLISMDVEGAEAAILRGGRETVERARPIILCEVLTDEAGRDTAAALPDGYLFFEIDEDRGVKQAPLPRRRVWRYYNWLLVPEERRAEIDVW